MTMKRKAKILATSVALFATATTGVLAAQATTNLNVRAWPNGTVVDVLHPGEHVRIVGRSGNWCQIEHHGPDGWSACRYLTNSNPQPGTGYSSGSVTFSFGSPNLSISIGSGGHQTYRPWTYRRNNACIWHQTQWYCPVN